jgi:hypothetical protein
VLAWSRLYCTIWSLKRFLLLVIRASCTYLLVSMRWLLRKCVPRVALSNAQIEFRTRTWGRFWSSSPLPLRFLCLSSVSNFWKVRSSSIDTDFIDDGSLQITDFLRHQHFILKKSALRKFQLRNGFLVEEMCSTSCPLECAN